MTQREKIKSEILNLNQKEHQKFEDLAFSVFQYQYSNNKLFKKWCDFLHSNPNQITSLEKIPFLPISFFKSFEIKSTLSSTTHLFRSSGTTTSQNSQHHVCDIEIYEKLSLKTFETFFGSLNETHFLALLPNYLEQGNSSLVFMIEHFMKNAANRESGFFLNNWEELNEKILALAKTNQKVVLWGVTYALLDFSETFKTPLGDNFYVFETGGMKGRKKEMTRPEVHEILKKNFGQQKIYSEYGMTELLSQAYITPNNQAFTPAPTMKTLIREQNDPFEVHTKGRGLLNIIDLANLDSCSFIATDDVGLLLENGDFDVLGRADMSENRGCNLMWTGM